MWWLFETPFNAKLPPHCEPTNEFLFRFSSTFQTCIPTPLAFISNALGVLSIVAWLFSQLPQIYKNWKISSTSGLSAFFLLQWMIADLCNLLGAIFTKQASWQVAIGSYYVFVDICLCSQWLWYEKLRYSANPLATRRTREKTGLASRTIAPALLMAKLAEAVPLSKPLGPPDGYVVPSASPLLRAGTILSWTAAILYLCSRFPQIVKNWQRRSTEGLSLQLFVAAFCGNLFYSLALLTNPCAWSDFDPHGSYGWVGSEGNDQAKWIITALPFFLGAAGVLVLDAAVGAQFMMYGKGIGQSLIDEQSTETTRQRRLSGWMRGWFPRSSFAGTSREREALLRNRNQRTASYGAMSSRNIP